MPKVLRRRDPLLSLVQAAQKRTPSPNSAPAICHVLLHSMRAALLADADALNEALAEGLNARIRRMLKHGGDEDERGVTARQLEFFPIPLRGLVSAIDRARVFVPSRGEYVPLDPLALTAIEVREAGEHLIGKGEETIKRGHLLVKLASELEVRAA